MREQESLLESLRTDDSAARASASLGVVVEGEAIEITDEKGNPIELPVLANGENGLTHHGKATVDGRTFEFEIKVQQSDA